MDIRIGLSRWLAAACIAAIATLGFAHQRAADAAPPAIDLAVYALPDGTLPSICSVGSDEGSGDEGPRASRLCVLCLLIGAPGLPPPAEAAMPAEYGGDVFPCLHAPAGPIPGARSAHVPHLRGPPPAIGT